MWEISTETVVAAAHRLRYTTGEGERLHGHNWRIRAVVRAEALDGTGWVLDFNHVAAVLRALVEPYEHAFLNDVPPFDDLNPTAENLPPVVAPPPPATLDTQPAPVRPVDPCAH